MVKCIHPNSWKRKKRMAMILRLKLGQSLPRKKTSRTKIFRLFKIPLTTSKIMMSLSVTMFLDMKSLLKTWIKLSNFIVTKSRSRLLKRSRQRIWWKILRVRSRSFVSKTKRIWRKIHRSWKSWKRSAKGDWYLKNNSENWRLKELFCDRKKNLQR